MGRTLVVCPSVGRGTVCSGAADARGSGFFTASVSSMLGSETAAVEWPRADATTPSAW